MLKQRTFIPFETTTYHPEFMLPARAESMLTKKYSVIMCDFPHEYKVWSEKGKGRSAENHYQTMSYEDALHWNVSDLAAKDCMLFYWGTWPTVRYQGRNFYDLPEAWGFEYKTMGFVWLKQNKKDRGSWFTGTGYYTRANTEPCWLFTRGDPKIGSHSVHQIIDTLNKLELPLLPPLVAPVGDHSAKPIEAYRKIDQLTKGPFLDMFSRMVSPGKNWDTWGNEAPNCIPWQPQSNTNSTRIADKLSSMDLRIYLREHYPGIEGEMAKRKKPKDLPYAVPEEKLIKLARTINGWSLHSYGSTVNADNRVVTVLEFKFRGAFLFPSNTLKIEGVDRVSSYVKDGTAKVWVTWKSVQSIL